MSGLSGRGLLEKFGPNHVLLPIITRKGEWGGEGHELEVLLDCRVEESWCLPEFKGAFNDSLPQKVCHVNKSKHIHVSPLLICKLLFILEQIIRYSPSVLMVL